MARFVVGIDLGTTNSALAYVDLQHKPRAGRPEIQTFPVPQLVAPGELASRQLLPSFLYLPGAHDLPAGSVALPWDPDRTYAVGEFARNHGARVDRSAPLLPWSAPPDVARISPVEASARYLKHLVEGWNYERERDQPAH